MVLVLDFYSFSKFGHKFMVKLVTVSSLFIFYCIPHFILISVIILPLTIIRGTLCETQHNWWHCAGWRRPRARQCCRHRWPQFWLIFSSSSSCLLLSPRSSSRVLSKTTRGAGAARMTSSRTRITTDWGCRIYCGAGDSDTSLLNSILSSNCVCVKNEYPLVLYLYLLAADSSSICPNVVCCCWLSVANLLVCLQKRSTALKNGFEVLLFYLSSTPAF